MDPLRLHVTPRGSSFVAESRHPALTAVGPSPADAAENARLVALALFGTGLRPTTLIVRLDQPGMRTIIMQPIDEVFQVLAPAADSGWRYIASVSSSDDAREVAE
jgi:hypothetical protein